MSKTNHGWVEFSFFSLTLYFLGQAPLLASQGGSVENGGIDGIYSVTSTELPQQTEILRELDLSQLLPSVKDPLISEVKNSRYLKADRDVEFTGAQFPGDWYIGDEHRLFYARTMPNYGGATTLFPVFYTLPRNKQIEILIHEAVHRLEFLSPNNSSEDYVVATVKKITEDIGIVQSGNLQAERVSKAALESWFMSTQAGQNIPMNRLHWVGFINVNYVYNDHGRQDWQSYSALFSVMPMALGTPQEQWYVEAASPVEVEAPNGGIAPSDYLSDVGHKEFRLILKKFYILGHAGNLLDPIRGLVYDRVSNLYMGSVILFPFHDGGTGAYYKDPSAPPCSNIDEQSIPSSCYGPGPGPNHLPEPWPGSGTGTHSRSGFWPFNR